MRNLLRSKARANMEKAGYTHVNRKYAGRSFFSRRWREFI